MASEAELAQWGLTIADLDAEQAQQYLPLDVWPENWLPVMAFNAMQTQWRVGYNGATGLDYNVLPSVFELTGVQRADWPEAFECVRFLEDEAMAAMGEQSA